MVCFLIMNNQQNILGTAIRGGTPKLWGDTDYIQETLKLLILDVIKSMAGVRASNEEYSHYHLKVYSLDYSRAV